jgi:sugar phosphate isomerase/epimerase
MGFGGIAFEAINPTLNLTELSQTGRREFRQMLAGNNLALVALNFDAGAKGFAPGADIERAINRADRVMEAAAGLGAEVVCMDLGPLPPAPATSTSRPKVTPQQAGLIIIPELSAPQPPPPPVELTPTDRAFAAQLDDILKDLCARADRYGVILAARSDLASFAALENVTRRSGCSWIGIDLDPVAILRDEWPIDEVFSRLGSLIRHVRARDAIVGAERRTRPASIGQGATDWLELVQALDAAGYSGWITIDPTDQADRRREAIDALDRMRSIAFKK